MTDCASPRTNKTKQESQLKTLSVAVDLPVVWDATVVSHLALGNTSKIRVLLPETNLETINGAGPTPSLFVITTPQENTNLVEKVNQHPNA